jgi:hypothetical protein
VTTHDTPEAICGAPAVGGPCDLLPGHNRGYLDVPANHRATHDTPEAAPFDADRLRWACDLIADLDPERQRWARWIVEVGATLGPDWACAECRPESDVLVDGFVCCYHEARAALEPTP